MIYSQLIFNIGTKTIKKGKWSFQQLVLGQLDSQMHKNEVGPLPHTIHKS